MHQSFQIKLLAYLCLDETYARIVLSYLREDYFTTLLTKTLFTIIHDYYTKYKQAPTISVLECELADNPPLPEEMLDLRDFLSTVRVGVIPEKEWIKDNFKQFVQSQQLKLTLSHNTESIDAGNFDVLVHALRKEETDLSVIDQNEPRLTFSLQNLKELYDSQGGMKTGISLIDVYVGGIMKKELMMLLADTNVGKSLLLCAIGGNLVKNQYRVLHVSLEMSIARTLIRYYATLSDPTDKILYNNILAFDPEEAVFNYITELKRKYEGYLFVEELPTGKGSIGNLYTLIDRYKPIDVMIVDYLDLLQPLTKREARRFELADLSIALRGLGVETALGVLSATQTSRLASGKRIVGKELVAEDYEKIRVSDSVIGMGQSKEDALKHEVVLYLTKSRNTERDKAERYFIDFNRMQFHLLRQELLGYDDD